VVNLTVGTPPQQVFLALDTASADFLLPAFNSSGCLPNPCPPGTFDPRDSSTSTKTGFTYNASLGLTPDLMIVGSYINDTVKIGDAVIPEMTGEKSLSYPLHG
jgi:hypothetical protein